MQSDYSRQKTDIDRRIEALNGSNDPEVVRLATRLAQLKGDLPDRTLDADKLERVAAAEFDGNRLTVVLSTGETISTTGDRGNGEAFRTLDARAKTARGAADALQHDVEQVEKDLKTRQDSLKTTNSDAVESNQADLRKLQRDHAARIAVINPNADGPVRGLLIRRDALSQLERDTVPETEALDLPKPCPGGASGLPCSVVHSVLQPTPLGPYVAAFRLLFLAVELAPVLLKIMFSLRRRRPYDSLEAALEEVAFGTSVEMLDSQLVQIGAVLESRASWRKAQRSGTGAEFILSRLPRSVSPNGKRGNVLEDALDRKFEARIRLWPRRRGWRATGSHAPSGDAPDGRRDEASPGKLNRDRQLTAGPRSPDRDAMS